MDIVDLLILGWCVFILCFYIIQFIIKRRMK